VDKMRLVTGTAHPELAKAISRHLGQPLTETDVGHFPDGETKVRILEDVRGKDCFVIQPTCPPVNQTLMELLIIIDALRRASAQRITAVIPYFGYARQDRKHEGRVPITAKLTANLLSTAGIDRLLAMDLHASQIQGFFDIPVDHLFATPVMFKYIQDIGLKVGELVIMAPDPGRLKVANAFAKRLNASLALVDKRRVGDSEVECGYVIGEVAGKDAIIVDDMITTAGTISQAIQVCRQAGARSVRAMVTHAVFSGPAYERLRAAGPDEVVVTDTIPLHGGAPGFNLKVLPVADLLGEAIRRIRKDESLSRLFV
jgi:ribose-phosphate pyrophosphokinase